MLMEQEAPEEIGAVIRYDLSYGSISDQALEIPIPVDFMLTYTKHRCSSKF